MNQGSAGAARRQCGPPGGANFVDAPAGWLDWLHGREPVAVIGHTIRLFHVTHSSLSPDS